MKTPLEPREAARAGYESLAIYDPAPAACAIDLSENTNRFGAPPSALKALAGLAEADVLSYPSPYSAALREALGAYGGVAAGSVIVGAGSDDLLDSAFRALAAPGERVAFPDPTFSMVPAFARANGLEPVAVPCMTGGRPDVDALLDTGAPLIYVCSPNNPTGAAISRPDLERLIDRAPGRIVLDEAYAEFGDDSWASAAPSLGHLLVLRTLSKAWGLAGLRIGWGAGTSSLICEVMKARGPYKVGAASERAASSALRNDSPWMAAHVRAARAARADLIAALERLGFAPLPSHANFVLVPVADSAAAAATLERAGIRVRAFAALTGIGDALRITVGPPAEMAALVAAIQGVPCA